MASAAGKTTALLAAFEMTKGERKYDLTLNRDRALVLCDRKVCMRPMEAFQLAPAGCIMKWYWLYRAALSAFSFAGASVERIGLQMFPGCFHCRLCVQILREVIWAKRVCFVPGPERTISGRFRSGWRQTLQIFLCFVLYALLAEDMMGPCVDGNALIRMDLCWRLWHFIIFPFVCTNFVPLLICFLHSNSICFLLHTYKTTQINPNFVSFSMC